MAEDTSRLSLREAQRAVTEQRIIEALAALIDEEHPLEISMAAVARRAGVSEPTLYRHFPAKRDLFAALAGHLFRVVSAGLAPAQPTTWLKPRARCSSVRRPCRPRCDGCWPLRTASACRGQTFRPAWRCCARPCPRAPMNPRSSYCGLS